MSLTTKKGDNMKIALTGATGFIGRYVVEHLGSLGHSLRCWHRSTSDTSGFDNIAQIEWIEGDLGETESTKTLVDGCDAVVHAALYRPGAGFVGAEGDIVDFVEKNVLGTLKLIEAARSAGAGRFITFSTCAVHDQILDDRPLDETHPLWAKSHYGAHKAAIEKFVHSYGLGQGYQICALRPTGVYGVARPPEQSNWYDLVSAVARGEAVECSRGGKEVHAADVAKAVGLLLTADGISGQAFNCYDRYVSELEVAKIARAVTGSDSPITGEPKQPKHQIVTEKIQKLGMEFGGQNLLTQTIEKLIDYARQSSG